jgi:S1-C subfamily serine protease
VKRWDGYVLAAVTFALFFTTNSSRAQDDASHISGLRQSIIFVTAKVVEPTGKVDVETGTGFIITSSGYAITANHLLQSRQADVTVTVGSRFGEALPAYVANAPDLLDAALLQLPDTHRPYTPVQFANPAPLTSGAHLVSAGFPLTSDYSSTFGTVSNTASPHGYWQVTMPLNYGNSGSPVLDSSGRVIGMVVGGIASAQQINYIIPLNLLSPLLIQAGLQWPPWTDRGFVDSGDLTSAPNATAVTNLLPAATPPPLGVPGGRQPRNCHEVTEIAAGVPPVYTKRTECE